MAADKVAPLIELNQSSKPRKNESPPDIRRMFNRRKKLLRIEQCKRDGHHIADIRALNKSIRKFYAEKKKSMVRSIANGNKGNSWSAV